MQPGERRQGVERAGRAGRARRHFLAARIEHAAAADRREQERQRESECPARSSADRTSRVATAQRGRNVTSSNARQFSRSVISRVGAAVDVVEHDARQAPLGRAPEIRDVHHL